MSIIFAGLKDSSKDNSESDSENFQRTTTFPEAVIENKKSSTKSKEDNLSSLSKNDDISDNELYIAESPSYNYNAIILLFCYNINFFYINFSYTIFIYSPSIKNPKTH